MSDAADKGRLPDPETTHELMPAEVAQWVTLPADERPCLLDCREPEEIAICRIEGSVEVPLGEIPASVERLKDISERGLVIYCHHGMRSMQATTFLRSRGIENCFSLAGGIELWARQLDPDMARY